MKKIFLGGLVITIVSLLISVIGLKTAGYNDIKIPQRVWVDGSFEPLGILTPLQVEGPKSQTNSDSIVVTQSYVWGQGFKTVAMQYGEAKKTAEWADSLAEGLGAKRSSIDYFYGESRLAKAAHGNDLEELLAGKTFTKMEVVGYASPEAGTASSLLKGAVDAKNIDLAEARAKMTETMIKDLFLINGNDVSGIKSTTKGEELQLPLAMADGLATKAGFEAVKASNRSGKDTLGFNAHSELSKLRFTSVKLNYTDKTQKTMVVTQPFLLPLLLLWLLWNLLKRIPRIGTPNLKTPSLPRWRCRMPRISCGPWSWPNCGTWNCNFNWCKWPSCGSLPNFKCSPCDWSWLCFPCFNCTCTPPPPQEDGPCCCYRKMRNGKRRWRLWVCVARFFGRPFVLWLRQRCICCLWKVLLLLSAALNIWFYMNRC